MTVAPAPFLKWAGGKRRLLPEILPLLPSSVDLYAEPFLGGGAVFFALAHERRFKRAILSDANERLIRTYRAIQWNVESVIEHLTKRATAYLALSEEGRAEMFAEVRGSAPADDADNSEVAAWVIFMNRTCFNGLWRVNGKGAFNVPHGRYETPRIVDPENLRACALALERITIQACDYRETIRELISAGGSRSCYLDPPYVPISKTSNFTAYAGAFTMRDQEELSDLAKRASASEVRVVASNSWSPETETMWSWADVQRVVARRDVGASSASRGSVREILASSKMMASC